MAGEKNSKYKPEYDEQAYKLCLLGLTDAQLADFFGVCEATINNWKKEHPSFLESLKKGKLIADAEVAASTFKRATGFQSVEIKEETGIVGGSEVNKTTVITKEVPPDTGAAAFWLKIRQRDVWGQNSGGNNEEAQSLNISFEVKEPVGEVKVTEGKNDD